MYDHSGLTAEEVELLPSEEDVRLYSERGWYLSEKLLTDAEVDTLTDASERYYAGQRDRELPKRPDRLADWTPPTEMSNATTTTSTTKTKRCGKS